MSHSYAQLANRRKGRRWTALPPRYADQTEALGLEVVRDTGKPHAASARLGGPGSRKPRSGHPSKRPTEHLRSTDLAGLTESVWSEFDHQVKLISHCEEQYELQASRYPGLHLINASANGGLRKRGVSGQLKAMGVKSGFPDIQLPVARGSYLGLFIELKKMGGRPSDTQLWWQTELEAQGHKALIIRGWRAAWEAIEAYYALSAARIEPAITTLEGNRDVF